MTTKMVTISGNGQNYVAGASVNSLTFLNVVLKLRNSMTYARPKESHVSVSIFQR